MDHLRILAIALILTPAQVSLFLCNWKLKDNVMDYGCISED